MVGRVGAGRASTRWTALAGLAALIWTGSAHAITVDFADYQGAASGNSALIEVEGYSISISASPSSFDLAISSNGLGVTCTAGYFACLTNSSSQIDAEWNEQVALTFNNGPVSLQSVVLSQLYLGELAVIDADGEKKIVYGKSLLKSRSDVAVDLDGIVVETLVFSAKGLFSDLSVRSIDFVDPGAGPVRPGPTSPIPEPTAALLFGAGLLVTQVRRRDE